MAEESDVQQELESIESAPLSERVAQYSRIYDELKGVLDQNVSLSAVD